MAAPLVVQAGVSDWILEGFGTICQAIVKFLGQLMLLVVGVLVNVAQYNGFVTEPAVANGWVIVRDVCNMFFIAVLLLMAIGTIIPGLGNFTVKGGNLTKLLITAIVINFSRTICGLLIDFSQVVMLTFVSGFREAAGGNFVEALGMNQILQANPNGDYSGQFLAIIAAYLLAICMAGVALFTVTVITVSLIVRIIYLWLLVIISPMAFFARAVPAGFAGGIYARWWGKFTSFLVGGPLQAFFLWLALVSVQTGNFTPPEPAASGESVGGVTAVFQDKSIQKFLVATCLLLVGNMLAKEMGGEASGMGFRAANALKGAAKWVGKKTAKGVAGATGLDRAYDKVKEKALSAATRIPLVRGAAADSLGKHRMKMAARDKDAAAMMQNLTPEERARFEKSWGLGADSKSRRKEALRANVKSMAEKGFIYDPKKGGTKAQQEKDWRRQFFDRKKSLAALGKATGDPSIERDIIALNKENPSLIFDEGEKDLSVRQSQMAILEKMARRKNAKQIGEMTSSDLSEQFVMSADATELLRASQEGTGEAKGAIRDVLMKNGIDAKKLEGIDMKNKGAVDSLVADIKQSQDAMRAKSYNFEMLDADGQREALSKMNGGTVQALARDAASREGGTNIVADLIRHGKGEDVAAALDPAAIKGLPKEMAQALRQVLIEQGDKTKALASGASIQEVFPSLDQAMQNFGKLADRQQFQEGLRGVGEQGNNLERTVETLDGGDIEANGGINDITMSVVTEMDETNLVNLAKSGRAGDQVAALTKSVRNLSGLSDSDIASQRQKYKEKMLKDNNGDEIVAEDAAAGWEVQLRQAQAKAQEMVKKMESSTLGDEIKGQTFSGRHKIGEKGHKVAAGAKVAAKVALVGAAAAAVPSAAPFLIAAYVAKKVYDKRQAIKQGAKAAAGAAWDSTKAGAGAAYGGLKTGLHAAGTGLATAAKTVRHPIDSAKSAARAVGKTETAQRPMRYVARKKRQIMG